MSNGGTDDNFYHPFYSAYRNCAWFRNGFLFEKDDVARLPFLMEKILNPTTLSKLSKECKLDSAKYDIRTTANDYGILFRKYGENR